MALQKQRFNVFTVMLIIAWFALLIASIVLYVDLSLDGEPWY